MHTTVKNKKNIQANHDQSKRNFIIDSVEEERTIYSSYSFHAVKHGERKEILQGGFLDFRIVQTDGIVKSS